VRFGKGNSAQKTVRATLIASTMRSLLLSLIVSLFTLPLLAQDALPKTAESFEVGGNEAVVYAAPKPAEGLPHLRLAIEAKRPQTDSIANRICFKRFIRLPRCGVLAGAG